MLCLWKNNLIKRHASSIYDPVVYGSSGNKFLVLCEEDIEANHALIRKKRKTSNLRMPLLTNQRVFSADPLHGHTLGELRVISL